MNKNERMNKLGNAGIDTSKYFTLNISESIPAGTKVHIVIDDNGNYVPQIVKENDVIANQIISDGYVRNTKLHRRFVCAQMFQMLNYVSYDGQESGFNAALSHYGYDYQFKMMLEEVKVLSKLEVRDAETFDERATFFTREVVAKTCLDYIDELKRHIENSKTYKCKGIPYKKVRGVNIFCADLNKKVYNPMVIECNKIKYASNYAVMYAALRRFNGKMIRLPYNTPKSKVWIDAYKGEGAYYTLKNLIMFHNCGVGDCYGIRFIYDSEAINELNMRRKEYQGEGWRMFALMKKVIKDNNFDFNRRMSEIYSD
jgi:hypothetical protein